MRPSTDLGAAALDIIESVALTDHHCHGVIERPLVRAEFEDLITESDRPAPAGCSVFDSQLGLAVRRHCAPVLGLPAFADADSYVARRAELDPAEVTRRFLRAGGFGRLVVETGFRADVILPPAAMGERAGAAVSEVVRLEKIAEDAATEVGEDAAAHRSLFAERLDAALATAVGVKTIAAYRGGLEFPATRPATEAVDRAYRSWWRQQPPDDVRLDDPVVIGHGLWQAIDRGVPIQVHVAFGDPDVDLRRSDPVLMSELFRASRGSGARFALLHCYPYHREAGYLAHVWEHVYCDVGLAINYTGAQSAQVLAESLELTPFHKALFSSDAWGAPELYHLGALLFRRGLGEALGRWFGADLPLADVRRILDMIAHDNATRLYGPTAGAGVAP